MQLLINSKLTPAASAQISVAERGFRFGDGLFETVAVHGGAPYQWAFHMERLQSGLESIRINYSLENLQADCQGLLKENKISEGFLRIYISRGQGGQGYLPDVNASPLVVIETIPYVFAMCAPVDVRLSQYKKISPKALPVQYKIAQGMQSTLAMLEAADHQCTDGLMLNTEGHITETTCGNICWLKDDVFYTPSAECGVLNGSSLHALIRLSPWETQEGTFGLDALKNADAVIITNCRVKAMPVASLQPLGLKWQSQDFAQKCYDLLMADTLKNN